LQRPFGIRVIASDVRKTDKIASVINVPSLIIEAGSPSPLVVSKNSS